MSKSLHPDVEDSLVARVAGDLSVQNTAVPKTATGGSGRQVVVASEAQIAAAIALLAEGNTIPFLARYRKEATGGLDEVCLRQIEDAVERAATLDARKVTVIKSIEDQEKMTSSLRQKIDNCTDLATLEAIYLPLKPKRKTRASVARSRGLQRLADAILAGSASVSKGELVAPFIDQSGEVPDAPAAVAGAMDIIAEQWSEDATIRQRLVDSTRKYGQITCRAKRGKKEQAAKFEQYLDFAQPLQRVPSHRVLAMLRGEAEGLLCVGVAVDDDRNVRELQRELIPDEASNFRRELEAAAEDCYDRLLLPATRSRIVTELKEVADAEAIEVFGRNLRDLLMAAPAGPRVTIGIDPGFRTGCKVAVVDGCGKFIDNTTIYPTPPRSDAVGAAKQLLALIRRHGAELIAIGNGTASRETDAFVGNLISENGLDVTKVMVSEAGASIYSASELAAEEFPDLDVTVRGAISIARRLQDPLAELVKTDPKSIGVGQYQHDVHQPQLRKCLDRTVESCVNEVGVDLNMASAPLLGRVAGIGQKLAVNIVRFRDENGRFESRAELKKVPKLGQKAFQQAAGFLRIRDGREPLDNSAVHPESYPVVKRMAESLGTRRESLVGNGTLSGKLDPNQFVDAATGLPTVVDIIDELARPGRDPRSEFRKVAFDESVNTIEDVKTGMVLEGVITNVTKFGAFIDLGVHQDGLIHISQLADHFVNDPSDVVSVGEVTRVKVLEVDVARKRISVTRKF